MKDGFLIEYDGAKSTHMFNLEKDPLQKVNILNSDKADKEKLEKFIRAFIQQYNNRLIENRLLAK
jgi:hypothetical protein